MSNRIVMDIFYPIAAICGVMFILWIMTIHPI